jgi:monothiol glutaredoxin
MDATLKARIDEQIAANPITIYMKGTTDEPQCGFSNQIVQIFKVLDVPFATINVLADDSIRNGIKEYSNWPTIPQVYIKGEFIGGCDIVTEMYQKQELQPIVAKALEA